jgi:hypothetical protein
MNYRQPNFNELFTVAHNKHLINMQATHFVNNSLAIGGIAAGFEGLPTSMPISETLDNDVIKIKIAESLFGTYFKNNWKVMLTSAIFGVVVISAIYLIQKENKKRKR